MSETEPDHSDSDDKYDDATDYVLHTEGGTSEVLLEDDDLLCMPDKLLLDAGDSFKSTCDKSKSHYSSLRSSRKEPVHANEKQTDRGEIGFVEPVPEQQSVPCKSDLCKYFYVIGNETLIVHSQEPWPKDVKLFQPYEVEQILLPDNANCLAVQAFLKMCNLDFQIEQRPNAEFMSPTGKVPFIKCGAFVVAELEGISSFVAQKGISLTEHLEPEQKSDMRAYQALINNVLGNAENYVCWCDRETYSEVTKPRHGSVYPWPLNLIQTWSKRSKQIKHLKTLGWYDKTLKEVFQEVETCCQALTDRLENNTYFFGNKYTELDALMYGHLYTILATPVPAGGNQFSLIVAKYEKLVHLIRVIDREVMGRDTRFEIEAWPKVSRFSLFGRRHRPPTPKLNKVDLEIRCVIDADCDPMEEFCPPQYSTDEDSERTYSKPTIQVGDANVVSERRKPVRDDSDDSEYKSSDGTTELLKDDVLSSQEMIGDTGGKDTTNWCFIEESYEIEIPGDGSNAAPHFNHYSS